MVAAGILLGVETSAQAALTGKWPDPLIPKVDAFFGETRNAFPAPVAAGQTQPFWVEIHIPDGQVPGMYAGKVTLTHGADCSGTARRRPRADLCSAIAGSGYVPRGDPASMPPPQGKSGLCP